MEYDHTGECSPEWDCCWQWLTWSYEYMKIIYENCGVKNYMKKDHRSYRCNFCSCEKKAWWIDNLCNGHFQTQFDSKIGYHKGCDV